MKTARKLNFQNRFTRDLTERWNIAIITRFLNAPLIITKAIKDTEGGGGEGGKYRAVHHASAC